jgi:hypothetical protein
LVQIFLIFPFYFFRITAFRGRYFPVNSNYVLILEDLKSRLGIWKFINYKLIFIQKNSQHCISFSALCRFWISLLYRNYRGKRHDSKHNGTCKSSLSGRQVKEFLDYRNQYDEPEETEHDRRNACQNFYKGF